MTETDDYVLGRGIFDSVRLDAQHMLWKLHKGYTLHPRITITGNMKIAELGTGTGIWLFDLARQLPPSVELHGFDISDDQFPLRDQWPHNVTLGFLDSLIDPPPELFGQYDVVHLRMWASNLKENDTGPIIRHVKRLLKPGGFIQWEDADLVHQVVEGEKAKKFETKMNELFQQSGLDYNWVSDLPNRLQKEEFYLLHSECGRFESSLVNLCTNTYLLALHEILQGIKKRSGKLVDEHEIALLHLSTQAKKEIVYNWSPVTVLAQRRK